MKAARDFDLLLLAPAAALVVVGVFMIHSAANESDIWKNQAFFALCSVFSAAAIVYVPERLVFGLAYPAYGFSLLLLAAVLVWGSGEPARWLAIGPLRLQPSELVKVTTVLALARCLGDTNAEQINSVKPFVMVMALTLAPMVLVAKQPDLGTAVAMGGSLFSMIYWAGMRPSHLLIIIAPVFSVIFSFEPLWGPDNAAILYAFFIIVSSVGIHLVVARLWATLALLAVNLTAGLYLWSEIVRDYQKTRILTMLDPESDPRGAGWNIIQSKIAIGSGGLTGKGFLEGTQAKYEFLPAAHTDFIFSVIGEELGFGGVLLVLTFFLAVISRSLYIGTMASNRFFSLTAIGLASMFTFHVFVNVGMTIGVMPVTGLPLPFLSYGGSSLLANWIAIGLLLHVYNYRNEY